MENLESEKATMLTTHELSQWLRVKESTIRKWVCYDRIPYLKVGRLVRISERGHSALARAEQSQA